MQPFHRAVSPSRRAVLAGAAATLAFPSVAFGQSRTAVKAAGVPEDSATPVLWAEQSGIFAKHGIDVQLDAQRSGSAIASGVAGGAYNIAKSSLVPLIIAHAKGVPFVLVAPGGLTSTAHEVVDFVVKADSTLRPGADLNGKTIAVSSLNDLYTVSIRAWVDANGGNSSSLKFIEMPIAAVAAAIDGGRVAGGGLIDPILQAALDAKRVRSIGHPFDAIAPEFLYTAWFTTRSYASSNTAAVRAFASAVGEASIYCNQHPAATVDLLSKFTGVAPNEIARFHRVSLGTSLDPKLIQPLIDACAKYKVIEAPFNAADMIAPQIR
jgi:NitT/TauT family transport system substrate-binding protein